MKTSTKFLKRYTLPVLNFLLWLFGLWLLINLVISAFNLLSPTITNFAFLDDEPLITFLLLLLCLALIRYFNHPSKNKFDFRALPEIAKLGLLFGGSFYLGIIISALLPGALKRPIEDDWVFLAIALAPALLVLLKLLIDKIKTLRTGNGGLEIEFVSPDGPQTGAFTIPARDLDRIWVQKGPLRNLTRLIEQIRQSPEPTKTMIVKVEGGDNSTIDFVALRLYIFKLSELAGLEFVVFVEGNNKFIAFQTAKDFKRKFPLLPLEDLLVDIQEMRSAEFPPFFDELRFFFRESQRPETREYLQREVLRKYWDLDSRSVFQHDLARLGAQKVFFRNNDYHNAYQVMLARQLPALPMVNDKDQFIGIVTKESIVEAILNELLKN